MMSSTSTIPLSRTHGALVFFYLIFFIVLHQTLSEERDASSSKASLPSTLRVFGKENQRFIIDPTLHSLEHGTVEANSFISPFGYELP